MENFVNKKVLLKLGVRSREEDKNPNYPILAWDGLGFGEIVVPVPRLQDSVREVDVFAVHKKCFVEQSGFVERSRVNG